MELHVGAQQVSQRESCWDGGKRAGSSSCWARAQHLSPIPAATEPGREKGALGELPKLSVLHPPLQGDAPAVTLTLPCSHECSWRCSTGSNCPLSPSLCPQTLQEQQAARAQSLAELSRWLCQAEDTLAEQQRAASQGDLSTLQQRQSDVKVSALKPEAGLGGGEAWEHAEP